MSWFNDMLAAFLAQANAAVASTQPSAAESSAPAPTAPAGAPAQADEQRRGFWQPGSFNDGQYTPEQWIAAPGDPTGDIFFQQEGFGGEGGNGTPGGYFDRGSGLAVGQDQIDKATLDQLRQLMGDGDYEQQIGNIVRATGSETGIGVGGINGLIYALEHGLFPDEVAMAVAPWADARRAEADSHRGFRNKLNDWADTEMMHFENIGESWQEDPERLLLGINTPLESKLWGGLLGKDYESNVNMYGGPTQDTYQESYEAGNDPRFNAASHSAIEGIIGGMAGAYLGGLPQFQTTSGSAALATGRAGFGALNAGGDSDAVRQALLTLLMQQGVDVAAPYIADASNEVLSQLAQDGGGLADAGATGMFEGMTPMRSTLGSTTFSPEGVPISSTPTTTTFGGEGMLPQSVPTSMLPGGEFAPMMSMSLAGAELDEQDATNLEGLEAGDAAPAESEPAVTSADVQKYAKVAKSLYEMLGQDEGTPPADAPTREEAEDAAHYSEELAQYMDLDPKAMADAGLEPGTPEYYEYIMAQADAVIAQVLEGTDVDAADFQAQLRSKTEAELLQLQRALYVRGQAGQLMGSGTYEDPATGTDEEVVGDGMFNPGTAAYQRGIARNVSELAGMHGSNALNYLNNWLGRDVDMFGMQSQADAQMELAKRTEQEDEIRKRGMFSY